MQGISHQGGGGGVSASVRGGAPRATPLPPPLASCLLVAVVAGRVEELRTELANPSRYRAKLGELRGRASMLTDLEASATRTTVMDETSLENVVRFLTQEQHAMSCLKNTIDEDMKDTSFMIEKLGGWKQ